MSDQVIKSIERVTIAVVIGYVAFLFLSKPKDSPSIVVTRDTATANITIINPTPSQTTISKVPVYIPPDYNSLVQAFLLAVKERDEVNQYDSTVEVKKDSTVVGLIPYQIKTKGQLLSFSMQPKIISTNTVLTRVPFVALYGGLGVHSIGGVSEPTINLSLQKERMLYSIGKDISGKGWEGSIKFNLITKYK